MRTAKQKLRVAVAGAALAALAGCAADGRIMLPSPHPQPQARHVKVPPGHMPPPGQCRIWYPDRPPGQQPPPGDCAKLRHHVPRGASLIRG